jgi:hypothetical protein
LIARRDTSRLNHHRSGFVPQPHFTFAQRWRHHREFRLPPGGVIDPREYGVEVILECLAKPFVLEHHYSGSFPAARLCVGLFRKTGVAPCRLVGIAVFGVPMNQNAIPRYSGLSAAEGVELSRFVADPSVAFNGESFFIRRAFECLRLEKPEIKAVLSYADPTERRNRHGQIVKRGHYGCIYQASNALYLGTSSKRTLILTADGQVVSERALSKIRNQERGHDYAYRQLVAAGAPERHFGEDPRDWLTRALATPAFSRARHPGNHVYLFAVLRAAKKALLRYNPDRPPYPKKADPTPVAA